MQVNEAMAIIKDRLSYKRYQHCVGVGETAVKMSQIFKVGDVHKIKVCGLLHDYARDMTAGELLEIAEKNNLISHPVERDVPDLLHGPVAAFLLKRDWDVNDQEILDAIKCHTLGAVNMSDFVKIVFLADMIEPGRKYPGVEELRAVAFQNLDRAVLLGTENTIKYCLERKLILHPLTIEVRNSYLLK
jgi:predicted HD superfamily hydrolase involved in NAD metabolism